MKHYALRARRAALGAASAILVFAALTGCHKGSDIVGKWHGAMPYVAGKTLPMDDEFKADGTFTQTVVGSGHAMVIQGTYTAKDGTLTDSNMRFTVNGHSMSMPGTQTTQYKIEGDTLTLTESRNPRPLVLQRVKG